MVRKFIKRGTNNEIMWEHGNIGEFRKGTRTPWETLINHLTMVSKRHLSIDQLREARRSAEIDVTKKVNKINQLLAARESADTIQSVLSEQQERLEEFKITHAA